MKPILPLACALVAAALVAGCGQSAKTDDASGLSDARLWATDACKTFPADAAGKAAGVAVTAAVPGGKSTVSGMQVSTCNYEAPGSGSFTVVMRFQGESGSTQMAIAGLNAAPEVTGPIVEVPVAQGKAFWVQRYRTLSLIPDEKRVVVVTPPGASDTTAGISNERLQQKALVIAQAASARSPDPNAS